MKESHANPSPILRPPVKWYGGKRYLARWITSHFPTHRVYLESFGGGASVLLNKAPSDVEAYNNLDERLTRFFRVLRDEGTEFMRRVRLVPYSQVAFRDAKLYPDGATEIEKAVCDFIRWRQSFAGKGTSFGYSVRRSRGSMAGDVHGWWSAIRLLPQIIERLQRVQILCQPAVEAIARFDASDTLIYCDPPYVQSTRQDQSRAIYRYELTDEEHTQLATLLQRCKAAIVVSGYPSALYDDLYRRWRRVTRDVPNHAAGGRAKKRKTECLWMNFTAPTLATARRPERTRASLAPCGGAR